MRTQLILGLSTLVLGCTTPKEETMTVYQALSLGGCEDEHSEIHTKHASVSYTEQERTTECSVFVDLRYMNKEEALPPKPPE